MYVLLLVNAIWWLEMGKKPRELQPPCGPLASVQLCALEGPGLRERQPRAGSISALQELMPGVEPPYLTGQPVPEPYCWVPLGLSPLPPPSCCTRAWGSAARTRSIAFPKPAELNSQAD